MKLITALLSTFIASVAFAQTPVGVWKSIDDKTGKEKSIIRITETGGVLSGKIEKLLDPTKQDAKCDECSDERKGKPVTGMTIIRNVKKEDDRWGGGDILDPNDGKIYRVRLTPSADNKKMDVRGYRFLKGHKIRLALSTSYWPIAWPSPEPVTLTVFTGATKLSLPLLVDQVTPEGWQPFGPPRSYPPPARSEVAPVQRARRIVKDVAAGETRLIIEEQNGAYRLDGIDWTVASSAREEYRITDSDPTTAGVEIALRWKFSRGDWNVATEIDTELTSDIKNFHCRMSLRAREGEAEVFNRSWNWTMPRDHL